MKASSSVYLPTSNAHRGPCLQRSPGSLSTHHHNKNNKKHIQNHKDSYVHCDQESRMIWGKQQTKPTSVNLLHYVAIRCHIFAGHGDCRSAGIMACSEQHEYVLLHLLIRKRLSLLIPLAEKAREDVFMSSDQASIHISPSLIDPYLQLHQIA